ncbi:tetratricopeptide repeat protein [Vibrio paucivorans]
MSIVGIAIGATGLSLILVFLWMLSLSLRKKRLEQEKREAEIAYRKALEKSRLQEHQERLRQAEEGHVPTILFLAKEAERKNIKEALYWYEKAAQLDSINGMYGVVRISERSREDMVLKERARFWQISIAAHEGKSASKFELAMALLKGLGTDVNHEKAMKVLEQAAADLHIPSILFLGDWCFSPENPSPTPGDSVFWYKKAADLNSPEGKMKLGLNYLKGIGVEKSHNKGCYWLECAAEKGHAQAMYHAGEAWVDRKPSGNAIAYIWLFLSAHFGYEPAKALRDKVGGDIGVDSVVGLQSLAKPLLKKISSGTVSKHSIIRALNKLYKRNIELPKKRKEAQVDDFIMDSDSNEDARKDNEKAPNSMRMDFSSTTMDKPQG